MTSDKANSTIQVDTKHITDKCHFRKKRKLSKGGKEVLREGKDINSPKLSQLQRELQR